MPGPVFAAALAFVSGFIDTIGFVSLFGLFAAHVTRNFVLIGAALVDPGPGVWMKLLAFPMFIVGVACATAYVRSGPRHPRRVLLGVQAALLATFGLIAGAAAPLSDPMAPASIAAALCVVTAMAVQNAASRLVFADLANTTVMTGNVTQIVIDAVDAAGALPAEQKEAARSRIGRLAPSVIAFALGAVAGALRYLFEAFAAIAIPMAVLVALAASPEPASVFGRATS